jgi:hypothetical protein
VERRTEAILDNIITPNGTSIGKVWVTVLSLGAIVLLGIFDSWTGYEISFSIFYVLPIVWVTWNVGRRVGFLMALASALTWLVADHSTGFEFTHSLIPFWNAAVRLAVFAVIVVILSKLHTAYQEERMLVGELRAAMEKVKVLSGLLPICAWCKRMRTEEGSWQQVEVYVTQRSEASFTHGICPECKRQLEQEMPEGSASLG